MLPRLLFLMLVGVHLSSQDLVTLAPSKATGDVTEPTSTLPKNPPKIRSLHITSDIKYRYATTLVSTRVVNPDSQAGEAVFSITLPESAFISGFLMEIKDKVYKAHVKEKKEAKAVYDEAVQAGQFAGHVALDARDSNSFTVSVNIEAHGKVTFNLTYEQLLSRNLGVYTNVININPKQIVDDMSVKVDIEEPTEITHLEIPEIQVSNDIVDDNVKENSLAKVDMKSPNHKIVTWAPTAEEQKTQNSTGVSGQFIVKYDVNREKNAQQILVDEGYFVHFFAPENLPKLKKHVVFILDFSGSMAGRKLDQLRDAMRKILSDLERTDYFSIVIFQSIVEAWSPKKIHTIEEDYPSKPPQTITPLDEQFVVEASSVNIDSALTYLSQYSDLGATNIMGGLRTGLELVDIGQKKFAANTIQPLVIFLTDGQPNVEVYEPDEIIKKTKPLNKKECPIFSLAFGYGADFNFLRKLSLSNNGFARNIYEAADASAQLKNFYRTVASPLFSNVTFTYLPGQVNSTSNTRQEFPVYFLGSEIVVAGKFDRQQVKPNTPIGKLSGISTNGIHDYNIIIDKVPPPRPHSRPHSFGHLEKTWAYLTIQQLLDKVDSLDEGKEKNETKAKALELALQYAFVTPLTSLVVVKPNETESVNTEKLKPGSESHGPFGPGGFGSLSFPVSHKVGSGIPGVAYSYDPIPVGPQESSPMSPDGVGGSDALLGNDFGSPSIGMSPDDEGDVVGAIDSTTVPQVTESVVTTLAPTAHKVHMNNIKWFQKLTCVVNNTLAIMLDEKTYFVGQNETDTTFGDCKVNGEDGECRHFPFCALDVFADEVSQFTPYRCPISGGYLGVCCPKNVS